MAEVGKVTGDLKVQYPNDGGQGNNIPANNQTNTAIIQNNVNNTGVGTQLQTNTNFNVYGKDIANFDKFKGNDKHDAMRMTTTAANDVKTAYMQLQHEFPNVNIAFETMPDPNTCGKKREGFFTYQQLLEDWKDTALKQIANAREASTKDVAFQIMENDNRNAAMNAGVTIVTGENVINNNNYNTALLQKELAEGTAQVLNEVRSANGQIIRTIKNSAGEIMQVVWNESDNIHRHINNESRNLNHQIQKQGKDTRGVIKNEAEAIRNNDDENTEQLTNVVKKEHEATRKYTQEEADLIIDTLDPLYKNRITKSIRDMATNAGEDIKTFIKKHPHMLLPGFTIPIGLLGKLFE